jgi:Flp pilus assembly protein TadG
MLVLPVLLAIFLGLATVGGMFFGQMDVSQAAEAGVQALAAGQGSAAVNGAVSGALLRTGYRGAPPTTRTSISGGIRTVTVSIPFTLWNTGAAATLTAARTIAVGQGAPEPSSGNGAPGVGTSGGGSTGGGGYIYHHFPMW